MLAGPGHEAVFYQMQPPFLSDARFVISANATQWAIFEQNLAQMRPDLVVVQVEIAPGPEALIQVLAEIQVWHGVAILVLPPALRDLRGTFEKAAVVRGVYIAPVNWGEIAQAGYAAAMTERARRPRRRLCSRPTSPGRATAIIRYTGGGIPLCHRWYWAFDHCRKPGLRTQRPHECAYPVDVFRSAACRCSTPQAALRPQCHGVLRPSRGWVCGCYPEPRRPGRAPGSGKLGRLPESGGIFHGSQIRSGQHLLAGDGLLDAQLRARCCSTCRPASSPGACRGLRPPTQPSSSPAAPWRI